MSDSVRPHRRQPTRLRHLNEAQFLEQISVLTDTLGWSFLLYGLVTGERRKWPEGRQKALLLQSWKKTSRSFPLIHDSVEAWIPFLRFSQTRDWQEPLFPKVAATSQPTLILALPGEKELGASGSWINAAQRKGKQWESCVVNIRLSKTQGQGAFDLWGGCLTAHLSSAPGISSALSELMYHKSALLRQTE